MSYKCSAMSGREPVLVGMQYFKRLYISLAIHALLKQAKKIIDLFLERGNASALLQ
jgi:hypothetical protein